MAQKRNVDNKKKMQATDGTEMVNIDVMDFHSVIQASQTL